MKKRTLAKNAKKDGANAWGDSAGASLRVVCPKAGWGGLDALAVRLEFFRGEVAKWNEQEGRQVPTAILMAENELDYHFGIRGGMVESWADKEAKKLPSDAWMAVLFCVLQKNENSPNGFGFANMGYVLTHEGHICRPKLNVTGYEIWAIGGDKKELEDAANDMADEADRLARAQKEPYCKVKAPGALTLEYRICADVSEAMEKNGDMITLVSAANLNYAPIKEAARRRAIVINDGARGAKLFLGQPHKWLRLKGSVPAIMKRMEGDGGHMTCL